MRELLAVLIGLKQYVKQYHWLAVGYENHILAEKLEEGLEDEIDELAELMLAAYSGEKDFLAKELLETAKNALESTYIGFDMVETLKSIAELYGKVLKLCKEPANNEELAELAFSDYKGRLSNSALRKLYLIQIQLKK